MKLWKKFDVLMKYFLLVGYIFIQIMSIHKTLVNPSDEIESVVEISKSILLIAAIVGLIGNFFVFDCLSKFTTGNWLNILTDILEEKSEEVVLSYNRLIAPLLFLPIMVFLEGLYIYTNIYFFLICFYVLFIISISPNIIRILWIYIIPIQLKGKSFSFKSFKPLILSSLICILLLLVTNNKNIMYFVYRNLKTPISTTFRILALIIVLCYILVVVFCHYVNLYYITAFSFSMINNPRKIQEKLEILKKKDAARKASLRQIAKYLDVTIEKLCFFKRIKLTTHFFSIQFRAYLKEVIYTALYLLSYGKLVIAQRFSGLLDEDRIRIQMIRFCEVVIVVELLTLNMLLFMYLGNDDPCSCFFELLSTVIIIPILLSSLSNLKVKKVVDKQNDESTKY